VNSELWIQTSTFWVLSCLILQNGWLAPHGNFHGENYERDERTLLGGCTSDWIFVFHTSKFETTSCWPSHFFFPNFYREKVLLEASVSRYADVFCWMSWGKAQINSGFIPGQIRCAKLCWCHGTSAEHRERLERSWKILKEGQIWQCVKTLYPFCSHQNSWVKMDVHPPKNGIFIGIDP